MILSKSFAVKICEKRKLKKILTKKKYLKKQAKKMVKFGLGLIYSTFEKFTPPPPKKKKKKKWGGGINLILVTTVISQFFLVFKIWKDKNTASTAVVGKNPTLT